jgi:putative transposase
VPTASPPPKAKLRVSAKSVIATTPSATSDPTSGTTTTYEFRLYPTYKQTVRITATLKLLCTLANAALEERIRAYAKVKKSPGFYSKDRIKAGVNFYSQDAQLKDIRASDPAYADLPFTVMREAIRRVDRAFAGFFSRVALGQVPGFPRFKSWRNYDSMTCSTYGSSCKCNPGNGTLYLQGTSNLKVKLHRQMKGTPTTLTLKRKGSGYFVSVVCKNVPTVALPTTGAVVGIDLGVVTLATLSDGTVIENPKYAHAARASVNAARRSLSRKKRGSKNYEQARLHLSNLQARASRQMRSYQHTWSSRVVAAYDTIVLEDLHVANMTRSAAGTLEHPGHNVAQKSGLNRSVRNASFSQFAQMITYKAENAGRKVIKVNPYNTSVTCSRCGYSSASNRLTQAEFSCRRCCFVANADYNASCVTQRAGRALLANT